MDKYITWDFLTQTSNKLSTLCFFMSPDLNSHMHVHIRHPPMSFGLFFDELVCYLRKVLLLNSV